LAFVFPYRPRSRQEVIAILCAPLTKEAAFVYDNDPKVMLLAVASTDDDLQGERAELVI
jgi:hypothetical protein